MPTSYLWMTSILSACTATWSSRQRKPGSSSTGRRKTRKYDERCRWRTSVQWRWPRKRALASASGIGASSTTYDSSCSIEVAWRLHQSQARVSISAKHVVEGAQQVAGVVGQDHLVVAVEPLPAHEVARQQREGPEVVGAVRDAPRPGHDAVEPVQLAGLEHPVGDVEDVGVPGELGEVVHDVVVDEPVGVVAGEQAGPADDLARGVRRGRAGRARLRERGEARVATRRAGSAAAGRPPRRSGRGGWPSSARGRSAGWGRAGCASRSRRSGGPGPGGAAAGAGRAYSSASRKPLAATTARCASSCTSRRGRLGVAVGDRGQAVGQGPLDEGDGLVGSAAGGRAPLPDEAPPAPPEVGDGSAALLQRGVGPAHRGRGG